MASDEHARHNGQPRHWLRIELLDWRFSDSRSHNSHAVWCRFGTDLAAMCPNVFWPTLPVTSQRHTIHCCTQLMRSLPSEFFRIYIYYLMVLGYDDRNPVAGG